MIYMFNEKFAYQAHDESIFVIHSLGRDKFPEVLFFGQLLPSFQMVVGTELL